MANWPNPVSIFKRLSSTLTFTSKPIPSKSHLHSPIPDSAFPKGYSLTGVHAGVKKKAGVPDLAVIISQKPAAAAGCFTRNAFKAAPVLVSQRVLEEGKGWARALVVNSGCANAVTGAQGLKDAWAMARTTDSLLENAPSEDQPSETVVMSTGVIGQNLPISKIIQGIKEKAATTLGSDFASWENAAKAFMTTDTFPKLRARTFTIRGQEYRLAGMDKGAGMIHPNMGPPSDSSWAVSGPSGSGTGQLHATLLGCILTDAPVTPDALQSALTYAVSRSFNSISVDGDMSTNDTILVLANGAAAPEGAKTIDENDKEGFEMFREELTSFAQELAQLVVRDGEGATKFVTVTVEGAATYEDAHKIASRISTSALVKTALYGEDANWGRILAATGSIPLSTPLDPTRVSVSFIPSDGTTPLPLLVNGEPEKVDEARASEIVGLEDVELKVELGVGKESARYWTCDFSYEYVRINGDYRT